MMVHLSLSHIPLTLSMHADANDATAGIIPDTTDSLPISTDTNHVTSGFISDTIFS